MKARLIPDGQPAKRGSPELPASVRPTRGETLTDMKHQRAAEMLRELRTSAVALSANADRLLARYS